MATRPNHKKIRKRVGRPPAGNFGERVTDYPQVSFRLPRDTRDKLRVVSKSMQQPQWRVIVESVDTYIRHLPDHMWARVSRLTQKRSR